MVINTESLPKPISEEKKSDDAIFEAIVGGEAHDDDLPPGILPEHIVNEMGENFEEQEEEPEEDPEEMIHEQQEEFLAYLEEEKINNPNQAFLAFIEESIQIPQDHDVDDFYN